MYTNHNDDGSGSSSSSSSSFNAYTVLSKTEEWISNTLSTANANANKAAAANNIPNNPYARKEVSYSCENPQTSPILIVSDLFRRLKEAREQGQTHAVQEEQRKQEQKISSEYKPTTFRQTHVIVIPGHFETFHTFDHLIQAINQARRNARDYIVDDWDDDEDVKEQWNIAINCAHLHPQYGQLTPKQQLQQLQQENKNYYQEVDVHLEQYKQARLMARRSPFPTVVIEVRATPVPEFTTPSSASSSSSSSVSAADIQKLEALFGQTAHMQSSSSSTNSFWDKIGNTIQEVSAVTPLKLAERFIEQLQLQQKQVSSTDTLSSSSVALTESNLSQVDAAYEFVFLNAAMLLESQETDTYYLVLPHFLSTAATSLEKFAMETRNILQWIHAVVGQSPSSSTPPQHGISIETFHPEHVDESKRSPVPIIALSKKISNDNKNKKEQLD
jgi:uncharacterized membrane protein